ncbi:MAG: rRNA maturation RNase YbeY [Candidatus Margulisbacteria bacterium]|nr:rRNA maturation RNase YbeY [Candidatus Margulisiibacteriota bacterium]
MNLQINFSDTASSAFEELIQKTIDHIKKRSLFPEGELSVSFITSEEMQELNQKYRNKETATDVLTFPIFDDEIIGDIYICLEEVYKKADTYRINRNEQLIMTLAHAFAHLTGYDHNDDQEREIMEDYEDFLLKKYL